MHRFVGRKRNFRRKERQRRAYFIGQKRNSCEEGYRGGSKIRWSKKELSKNGRDNGKAMFVGQKRNSCRKKGMYKIDKGQMLEKGEPNNG